MDWAESDSGQVTMNLQFASYQQGAVTITGEDGTEVFAFDPAAVLGEHARRYQGLILSFPELTQGKGYHVFVDGVQMAYTGTDVMGHPGMGGFGGPQPGGDRPELPEGEMPTMPEGQEPPDGFGNQRPEGGMPGMPEGEMPTWPDGERPTMPEGQEPPGGFGGMGGPGGMPPGGEQNTVFYMQDKVNFFTGLSVAQ